MNRNGLRVPRVAGILVCWVLISTAEKLPGQETESPFSVETRAPWDRFAIDASLRGADGVKLADVNKDGLLDMVTGWEESGKTKIYFHPGARHVENPWPSVTLGSTPNCEDAAWIDLNQDGWLDVVVSCEGREQALHLFFAPSDGDLANAQAWRHEILPSSQGKTRWMFSAEMPNGADDPAFLVGSKDPSGMVGLVQVKDPRHPEDWRLQKLADAHWIMSLLAVHVDEDQQVDVLYTDRKSNESGVYWLKNKGPDQDWPRTLIGGRGQEVMFAAQHFPRQSTAPLKEIFVAAKPNRILHFQKLSADGQQWNEESWELDLSRAGNMKGVAVGDMDQDGVAELIVSCESATGEKSGVWLFRQQAGDWQRSDVSGPSGIKFDLIELYDLDQDGDLDVITCEERTENRGLGVVWYRNPLK